MNTVQFISFIESWDENHKIIIASECISLTLKKPGLLTPSESWGGGVDSTPPSDLGREAAKKLCNLAHT